jgi:hypothetical protein
VTLGGLDSSAYFKLFTEMGDKVSAALELVSDLSYFLCPPWEVSVFQMALLCEQDLDFGYKSLIFHHYSITSLYGLLQ